MRWHALMSAKGAPHYSLGQCPRTRHGEKSGLKARTIVMEEL